MKIYAPVSDANGVWASVLFVNGVGETNVPHLIEYFKSHGYKVEDNEYLAQELKCKLKESNENIEYPDFDTMNVYQIRDWAKEHGYGFLIGNLKNKEKLIDIITR